MRDLRGNKAPEKITTAKAVDHFMWKVDDDLELSIGCGVTVTLIQGQYDLGFGIAGDSKDEIICKKYSADSIAFRFSVEDTSGTLEFKKFKNGELVQAYSSIEGEEEFFGTPLAKNDEGYIGEWEFVSEIEKCGVTLKCLQELELTIYNYSSEAPLSAEKPKRWFEFWK